MEYSDSEDSNIEFTGFNSEDIANDFYVPDSEPDSDISDSTVHSSDISNLGDESGESGNETNDGDQQAEWTQILGGSVLMPLNKQVAHCYLMALMLPQHHHLTILSFCSNQESSMR